MADKEPIKVEVVRTGMVEQPTAEEKKIAEAQFDQMYGKTDSHAPGNPVTKVESVGAPVAQGMNLTKEQMEFAANVADNKEADELGPEQRPNPVQEGGKPLAEAGKPTEENPNPEIRAVAPRKEAPKKAAPKKA